TRTVMYALSQFVGFNTSQIRYSILYSPGNVPLGTEMIPVSVSSSGTISVAPTGLPSFSVPTTVVVILSNVTGCPFRRSLVRALPTFGSPVDPLTSYRPSSLAWIGADPTITIATVLSQLSGFNTSQISYG